jgi:ElaB/YqjD/DUF883 family membrane-anchored ribosome-binding protein
MKALREPSLETFPDGSRLIPQILMRSEAMGTKSGKEIVKDLDTLRQDVSVLAEHLSGFLGDKSEEVAGDVKQGVQKIRENVGEAISQTAGRSRALARDGFDGIGQMIEDSVQERPFLMLAIAAGLGAILAARLSR